VIVLHRLDLVLVGLDELGHARLDVLRGRVVLAGDRDLDAASTSFNATVAPGAAVGQLAMWAACAALVSPPPASAAAVTPLSTAGAALAVAAVVADAEGGVDLFLSSHAATESAASARTNGGRLRAIRDTTDLLETDSPLVRPNRRDWMPV